MICPPREEIMVGRDIRKPGIGGGLSRLFLDDVGELLTATDQALTDFPDGVRSTLKRHVSPVLLCGSDGRSGRF